MSEDIIRLIKATIPLMEIIAKHTDNTVDDAIVAMLKQIFGGEEK